MASFSDLFSQTTIPIPGKMEVVKCIVLQQVTRGKKVYLKVDFGLKSEGIVDISEFNTPPSIGSTIHLVITDDSKSETILSHRKKILLDLIKTNKENTKVSVKILEKKQNNARVEYEGVIGNLRFKRNLNEEVGDSIQVYINKVNNWTFFCSFESFTKKKLTLKVGNIVNCDISSINDYFICAKIHGHDKLDALMSFDSKPSKAIYNLGDTIKAKILRINGNKVILSVNALLEDEFKSAINNIFDFLDKNKTVCEGNIKEVYPTHITAEFPLKSDLGDINIIGIASINELFWSPDVNRDPKVDINKFKIGMTCKFLIKDIKLQFILDENNTFYVDLKNNISILSKPFTNISGKVIEKNHNIKISTEVGNISIKSNNKNTKEVNIDDILPLQLKSLILNISYKDLIENPVHKFSLEYKTGQKVNGLINKIYQDFAIVDVSGQSCILRKSEMDYHNAAKDEKFNKLKEGQNIEVIIKSIQIENALILLSVKYLIPNIFAEKSKFIKVGDIYEIQVKDIIERSKRDGIIVSFLDEKLQGLIGFVSKEAFSVDRAPRKWDVGEKTYSKAVGFENGRVLLSIKAAQRDNLINAIQKQGKSGQDLLSDFFDDFSTSYNE